MSLPITHEVEPSVAPKRRLEAWLFAVFAGLLCLWAGRAFLGSMQDQLFLSDASHGRLEMRSFWSAPLDDVFIHFDFARSAARGYPFEWSEGNGYSSGGTSLLYPLVLALGYRVGYHGPQLMHWAAIVATLSVWGLLLSTRILTRDLGRASCYLVSLLVLSVGGLTWSLWSGMEVAFFLAIWAFCLYHWQRFIDAPGEPATEPSSRAIFTRASCLGFACALLVATRPESAILVACFSLTACALTWSRARWRTHFALLCVVALPAVLVLVLQAVANRHFTGEWSAAGGLVKLEANHPFFTRSEVWEAWVSNVLYQVGRLTNHHFTTHIVPFLGQELSSGWVLWLLAISALFRRHTRRYAVLLWLSILTWMMTVALNGQVRWQNERYAMPAVAWLLLAAGLGVAGFLSDAWCTLRKGHRRTLPISTMLALSACTVLFVWGGIEQYKNQLWFFGRASRNIWDQQIAAGRKVRELRGHRVLVGDAGAIPYMADLPALDFIGLGGYHDLPFARATRLGIAAGIELIQRLPEQDRPDLMALYPSWWGDLPIWFGERLATLSVTGNVICGGRDKVIYKPDFSALVGTDNPTARGRHERVRAEVDFADIVSEKSAKTRFTGTLGYVAMRLLPHPEAPARDLWDAGRILPPNSSVSFQVTELLPQEPANILLRVVTSQATRIELKQQDRVLATLDIAAGKGWQEVAIPLTAAQVRETSEFTLATVQDELIVYHLWVLQAR